MKIIRAILIPFSAIYGFLLRVRHFAYDRSILKSRAAKIPTIVVGNLALGGTGKSPFSIYLANWLSTKYRIAVLSRGYGRKTKGFRLLGKRDTALTAGDEALQIFNRKISNVCVAVCEDRLEGIRQLSLLQDPPEIVILDDAMQHRKLKPQVCIMLSTCSEPFFSDRLLPAGRLRDLKSRAMSADILIWTKCKERGAAELQQGAERYSSAAQFSAGLHYGQLKARESSQSEVGDRVVLLTGIAQTKPLIEYIDENFTLLKHIAKRDHHNYSFQEIDSIIAMANELDAAIITTEKDASRLLHLEISERVNKGIWIIPIEFYFHSGEDEFRNIVLKLLNPKK